VKERFGSDDPRSQMLRFHTQTAGSTLTAQQPEVNVVRTTLEALSAVLGGTQSLHTNAKDEALGLPTEPAALLALRTQQVIAYESGVAGTALPAQPVVAVRTGADATVTGDNSTSVTLAAAEVLGQLHELLGDTGREIQERSIADDAVGPAQTGGDNGEDVQRSVGVLPDEIQKVVPVNGQGLGRFDGGRGGRAGSAIKQGEFAKELSALENNKHCLLPLV